MLTQDVIYQIENTGKQGRAAGCPLPVSRVLVKLLGSLKEKNISFETRITINDLDVESNLVMFDKYCIDLESSVLLIVMGRSCIFTRRSGILPSSYPKSMIPISTMTGWWAFAYCLVCDDVVSGTVAGKIRRVIESFVITVRYRSFD